MNCPPSSCEYPKISIRLTLMHMYMGSKLDVLKYFDYRAEGYNVGEGVVRFFFFFFLQL